MVKSRALLLSQQVNQKVIQRYGDIQFAEQRVNGIRKSLETDKTRVTRHSHVPHFGNERAIARPQKNIQEYEIEPSKFQIMCCFVAGTFVAFSAMYVSDSIGVQAEYLRKVMNKTDSEIGWLSSIIFFPSLFMSIVTAPLVDKWGPIKCGIIFNTINCLISVAMPFIWQNYIVLLFVRLLFGFLNEPCWLVQSALISKYLPTRLESMGFGLCMSVSTSANLIGFFAVPPIMAAAGDDPDKFISQLTFTFWLNSIVSAGTVAFFALFCIPLMQLDKKQKQQQELAKMQVVQAQDVRYDRVTQSINLSFDRQEDEYRNNSVNPRAQICGPVPSQGFLSVLRHLKEFVLKIPNNMPGIYKFAKSFGVSLDYWLICISYVLLLSTCYGAQTMLLTFLEYRGENLEINGMVRSIASIVGGPMSGFLSQWFGQRPMFMIVGFVLSIFAFLGLFLKQLPPYIPMFVIGFFDGCSAGLAKSLFTYVVSPKLLNNAYAISGCLLNLGQFAFPPASGALILDFPAKGAGMLWFYIAVLIVGLVIAIIVVVRDRTIYRGVLSKKP